MLPRIKFDKFFCGVDFGSQRIKAGVLKIENPKDMQLVRIKDNDVLGFKDLAVTDLAELTDCLRRTLDDLSTQIGIKFKDIQLGVGGELVSARSTSSVMPLVDKGHKVITIRDIEKVNDQARLLGTKMDEEVLHNLPQNYLVDDINSVLTPMGLYGRKLGVESLIIVTDMNRVRNIVKAVNQAGYDVANIFFSSFVASEMTLTDKDKMDGCIFIDIGSKVTTVQIFKDHVLKFLDKVKLGGDDFTRSISNSLGMPFDLAEQIKKSYGAVMGKDQFHHEEILIKREDNYIPIKREMIYTAVEAPVASLVESISKSLQSSQLTNQINRGITLIGGGALLPGLIEHIGEATKFSVRLGHTGAITNKITDQGAVFSAAAGLAYNGYKKTIGYHLSADNYARWPKRVMSKLTDLYQDYF